MNRLFRTAAACCALAASVTTLAAQSDLPGADDDVIVITANREPTPVRDIGSAFSIVDRPLAEQRQSVFGADLLQDLPGIAISRTGTFGSQTQMRLRGAEANHVLVMIDGIEVNDIAGADEFNFANLTTFDVERIEVVRGPQSALWGSDATAGVVNIVTRKADEPLNGELFLEGGSFDTFNGGGRIGTKGESFDASLSASYLDTEGTNIARDGNEKDGYQNFTTTFNAGYDPLEFLQFDVVLRHTDAENDFDNADFGPPVDAADNRTEQAQTYGQLRGQLSLFDGFWEQQLRATWTDTQNETYVDGAWDARQDGQKLGVYYQSGLNLTRNDAGEATNTLILAADYETEDYKQRGIVKPFGDPNRDEDMQNAGLIAQYLARPVDAWALSLSVRYDINSDFDNIATWRGTTSYTFETIGTRLRASAGTGQKRPTFTERFGTFTNFIGNPDLKPEKSTGWDVGVDQSLLADRLLLELTYFSEKLEDEINGFFFDPDAGGFTAVNRDGTSDRKGIEAALTAEIVTGLTLIGSYTYVDSRQPSDSGTTRERRRPRHMAAANLNYAFARDRANLNLNLSYTGSQADDDFSTFPATPVTLDAYTLVNLAAEFAVTDALTVYGRVENLFDEDYENAFGFASPGVGGFVGARVRL